MRRRWLLFGQTLTGVAVSGPARLGVVRIITTPVLINRAADLIECGAFAGHFQNFHRAEVLAKPPRWTLLLFTKQWHQ
jgi:hypothetical protein